MTMTHDAGILALSIGIAIVAATAALRVMVHWQGGKRLVSPLLVGLAVCGMHYTAMMGMGMAPLADPSLGVNYFDGAWTEETMAFLAGLGVALTLFVGAALAAFRKMAEFQDRSDGLMAGA
jgi:NO-binding membrane sensor protein with MHYT domain